MKRPTYALLASGFILLQISLSLVALVPVRVLAHDDGEPHAETQMSDKKPETTTGNYEFITPEGCSLSLLARRALQLHDQQKDDVTLTPAAAMYAETNVVQRLGARLLEVGEKVTIERPLLDEYVLKSKSLSTETLAAWDVYANQADFNIGYIAPAVAVAPSAPTTANETESTEQKETDKTPAATKPDFKNAPRLSTVGWIVGLFALAGLYYLLDQRRQKK